MNAKEHPFVSLIVPCRNEARYLRVCLDTILDNDYPRDKVEVLVSDGRSEDGTRDIIRSYCDRDSRVRFLDNPKINVCAGMNRGLEEAKGAIVFKIDAHARYEKDYVSRCVKALKNTQAENVGGRFKVCPGAPTSMAKGIALGMKHSFGVGRYYRWMHSRHEPTEVETVSFGCYAREFLDRHALLYNENLSRGGDSEFNARLRKAGGKILLMPEIVFDYFSRASLGELWQHQFGCGYWEIVGTSFNTKITLRSVTPFLFFSTLLISLALSPFFPRVGWMALILGSLYLAVNIYFSVKLAIGERSLKMLFTMPLVFAVFHASRAVGSACGLLKRIS